MEHQLFHSTLILDDKFNVFLIFTLFYTAQPCTGSAFTHWSNRASTAVSFICARPLDISLDPPPLVFFIATFVKTLTISAQVCHGFGLEMNQVIIVYCVDKINIFVNYAFYLMKSILGTVIILFCVDRENENNTTHKIVFLHVKVQWIFW